MYFFFQAEDGIRDRNVTGVQTCALPICEPEHYGEEYKDRDNLNALPIIPSQFDYNLPKENVFLYNEIKNAVAKADRVIVSTRSEERRVGKECRYRWEK